VLKISLCGAARQVSKDFEAIVDTGFTGFLAMSMVEAFPLGLILTGASRTILADGSDANDLTALGTVVVGNEERVGTVLLSAGAGAILVGMEFLTTFEKTLIVSTGRRKANGCAAGQFGSQTICVKLRGWNRANLATRCGKL
jgi:predicted aspartyl protease